MRSPLELEAPGPARTGQPPLAAPDADALGRLAVQALIAEADLTPKPGLVDRRGSGAHRDLTLPLMHRSARSLLPCFTAMAAAARGQAPSQLLREELAAIGREGEAAMLAATGGANAHKGAIWALGLLVSGAAMARAPEAGDEVAELAAELARRPDPGAPRTMTHGRRAARTYGVGGARGEARAGFPHVLRVGLPALRAARDAGATEDHARLDTLLAIMGSLDDTCLLHRGGMAALRLVQRGARAVTAAGGASRPAGQEALRELDALVLKEHLSPGGSGDLLGATLFLDGLAPRVTPLTRCRGN